MLLAAQLAGLIALAGLVQAFAGWLAVRRFRARCVGVPAALPGITVLKPLHGDEPLLEEALASLCAQDYPSFQIVFGARSAADTALPVIARLRHRFPSRDIAVATDNRSHGENAKVGNLINMLPAARHDLLVIADSDVHAAPDYLRSIAAALAEPGTGLVTTLYAGRAATKRPAGALGATWITHNFLPGALLARAMGRQDCLGATMALRRETLAAIGGLQALVDHLADDHVLGLLVQRLGLAVRLAASVPLTTVPEMTLSALFRHELRWGRTIRALVPVRFALSALQYPLFWAMLAMVLSAGAPWAIALFLLAWAFRALAAAGIDRALGLGLATPAPIWLLPLRDLMAILVIVASYGGDRVEWRGEILHAGPAPAPEGMQHP